MILGDKNERCDGKKHTSRYRRSHSWWFQAILDTRFNWSLLMLVNLTPFETPLDLALLLKNGQKTSQGDANHLDLHHKMPGKSKNEPPNGGLY